MHNSCIINFKTCSRSMMLDLEYYSRHDMLLEQLQLLQELNFGPKSHRSMHYTPFRGSYQIWWSQGIPKAFDLWMTFDLWWGRFENVLLSLEGPNPTPMTSFSPIPQNTTKRIAGQPYRQTADRQTGRLLYFSSIDFR